MLLAVYIILIFVGLFAEKKWRHYDFVIIAFLFLITYLSTSRADYESYEQVYNWIGAGNFYLDTGYGWYYLCLLGNKLHMTYRLFAAVLLICSLLMVRRTVNYYIKNFNESALIWSLYLLYPALLDGIQTRFLIAQAMMIFVLPCLAKRNLKNFIIYTVTVLLAFFVHSACLFYLIFLLIYFFERIKKALIYIVILGTGFTLVAKNQIITLAAMIINNVRIERYLYSSNGVGIYGFIAYVATLILIYAVAEQCRKMSMRTERKELIALANLFYQVAVLSCILLPLSTFDTNIFRLQRPVWMIMYITLGMLRQNGVQHIRLVQAGFRIRTLEFVTAVLGFTFYIGVFNFNVIQSLLL